MVASCIPEDALRSPTQHHEIAAQLQIHTPIRHAAGSRWRGRAACLLGALQLHSTAAAMPIAPGGVACSLLHSSQHLLHPSASLPPTPLESRQPAPMDSKLLV